MRLDLAVARAFSLSRRAARDAVRGGRVDRDGVTVDEPGLDVPEDARLTWEPNRPARHNIRTRLSVLYDDDDVLIVDKPAGLLTVPTAERERDTLHARALDYLQHRYHRRPYAGIVHRLDKDTSGALVFARHREALHALQALFRVHDIEREYLALVAGEPPDSGILDADLVRDAGLGRRGVARKGEPGRRAVTRYRVVERLRGAALVSVHLETGRTHQIRVHFLSTGHPVLGDRVYRTGQAAPGPEAPRQMLHARRLGFRHPTTGAAVVVDAPVPEDFERVLAALRERGKPRPKAQTRNQQEPARTAPRGPAGPPPPGLRPRPAVDRATFDGAPARRPGSRPRELSTEAGRPGLPSVREGRNPPRVRHNERPKKESRPEKEDHPKKEKPRRSGAFRETRKPTRGR
ncbi:MAG: RluA family pseudouridine synthase [Acidobacteriota bacterium]